MNVTLPNGFVVNDVPDDMTQTELKRIAILNNLATPEDFGEDPYADERTIGGSAAEFGKGIARGFTGSFLSAAEGLAELADAGTNLIGLDGLIDSGEDNELVRLARSGRESINSSALGVDERYQDQWSTKFGEGLGSLASFFTPAGAVKVAGLAGKAASTTQLAGGLTLAGGAGAGDQAQRIQAARDSGIEVSQAQEDASIGLGTLVGFSEMAPIGSMLRKISKTAPKEFVNSIKSRLMSAAKSGGFEGLQEVSASIAQNAIERGVYNENLAVNGSLYDALASDEFTVGAASGFVADLVLNSVANRRGKGASQAEKEYESKLREEKADRIERGEQAVSDLQGRESQLAEQRAQEEQGLDFQPTEATIDPSQIDIPRPEQITKTKKRRNRYIEVFDASIPASVQTYQAEERVRRKTVKGKVTETRYIVDVSPDGTSKEIILSINGIPDPNYAVQELAPPSENLQAVKKPNPPIDYSNHIYNVMGRSFPTAGTFQVDMPDAENTSVAPNQVIHVSPDGKKTPFGRNVGSFEEASVIAGRLNTKIIDSQVTNSVVQAINTAPESYAQEVKSTLLVYGDTILHPDESTFTASSIDTAAKTTIAEGYQENRSAKDLVAEGAPRKSLTASQKINADRIAKGLPETNTFTPAEAKAVLRDNFSRLIRAPETLETAIYRTHKVKNKKTKKDEFVLVSENGDKIKDRPPTGKEAMEQLKPEGGRRRNIKFNTRNEAQSYAKKLNSKEGIDPRDIILEKDDRTAKFSETPMSVVKEALRLNNITNEINSPELRALAENFTGVKATGKKKIGDMNKGELKALVSGLRSLPRFDVPTKIPLFKHNRYTSDQFGAALEFVKQNDNDTTNLVGIAQSIGLDLMADPNALKTAKSLAADLEVHIAPLKLVPKPNVETQQEPLLLESPAPTVDIKKLTGVLRNKLDSYGLTKVGINLDYALRNVSRNAEGNLVFGIRQGQRQTKDKELLFDSNGKALMGAVRDEAPKSNYEAFYTPDVNGIFLGIDRVSGIKDMTPEQQEGEFIRLLDHEMIHAMRQLDLWTEKEWQLLSGLAGKRKSLNGGTFLDNAKINYAGESAVNIVEEAVAEMTREARAEARTLTGKPRTLVSRIGQFFTRTKNAINGLGYNSFDNVIQGIESGEIGTRARGEIRTLLETERARGVPFVNAAQALAPAMNQERRPDQLQSTQGASDFAGVDPLVVEEESNTGKDQAREFLSDGITLKDSIPEVSQDSIDKTVKANLKIAKGMPSNQVPEFNVEAEPRSQYIAQNPEKGASLVFENDRYSARKEPEYDPRTRAELDKLVTKAPSGPASTAYLNVTNTTPIGEFLTRQKAKYINKWARLENIYQTEGFRGVLADSSALAAALFADRSKGITSEAIKNGFVSYKNGLTKVEQFTHKGKSYRGLVGVMAPLFVGGNKYGVDLEKLAQAYAVARRSERLRAEEKEVPAEAASLSILQSEINKYKDDSGNNIIEEWFDTWQAYNRKTVEFLMDTGVLDAKTAETWMEQSDYVPFYRQAENPDAQDKMPKIFSGMTSAATFKELKGGDTAVTVSMLDAITRNLDAAISMGMRNVAQQRIVRDMNSLGLAREVKAGQMGNNIISFRVDGQKRDFAIDDPLMYESMQSLGGGSMEKMLTSVVGVPSTVLREMITRDPGFMMVNMMRDTLSSYVTSGSSFIPVIDTLKNALNGADTLSAYGVVGGYDFGNDPDNMFKEFQKELSKRGQGDGSGNLLTKPFIKLWDGLGQATTMSDAATRKAVFDDVLARTGNEAEAAYQALEVINFSRRGNSPLARVITAAIPFLNARFQGLDVFYRSARGQYNANKDMSKRKQQMVLAQRALTLSALTGLYWILVSDDDQYKEADEHTRDNNWLIPTPWGVPIKIPIPFEVGLMFKTIPEKILAVGSGKSTGREARQSAVTGIMGTLEINPFGAQIVAPLIEAGFNYNFFTGNPIVSPYIVKGMEGAFQDRVSTNQLAKEVGEVFNVSPLKVEHVMRGYTGTIGTYILGAVDEILRSPALTGDKELEMPSRPVTEFPIIKRFFASSKNSGAKEDFYELHGEIKKIVGTLNNLKKEGRIDEYIKYLKGRESIVGLRKNVNYVAERLSTIRKQRDSVMKSNLDPDRKREIIDELTKAERETLKVTSVLKAEANLPVFDTLYR